MYLDLFYDWQHLMQSIILFFSFFICRFDLSDVRQKWKKNDMFTLEMSFDLIFSECTIISTWETFLLWVWQTKLAWTSKKALFHKSNLEQIISTMLLLSTAFSLLTIRWVDLVWIKLGSLQRISTNNVFKAVSKLWNINNTLLLLTTIKSITVQVDLLLKRYF